MTKNPQFTKNPSSPRTSSSTPGTGSPRSSASWSSSTSSERPQQIAPIPYSEFQQLLRDGKVAEIGISDRYIQGKLKEPLPSGQDAVRDDPRRSRIRRRSCRSTASVHRAGREHVPARPAVLGRCRSCCSSASGPICRAAWRPGRAGRRADADRQEQGQGLCRDRHRRHASTTSPASTRPRTSCRRSSSS